MIITIKVIDTTKKFSHIEKTFKSDRRIKNIKTIVSGKAHVIFHNGLAQSIERLEVCKKVTIYCFSKYKIPFWSNSKNLTDQEIINLVR